jgi:hypothetical protein
MNSKFMNWLNGTEHGRMVRSYVNVFVVTVLTLFLADGADLFSVSADDLRVWLAAGLAPVISIAINYLNPRDYRYGLDARKQDAVDG